MHAKLIIYTLKYFVPKVGLLDDEHCAKFDPKAKREKTLQVEVKLLKTVLYCCKLSKP